jgi:hypothetical protein
MIAGQKASSPLETLALASLIDKNEFTLTFEGTSRNPFECRPPLSMTLPTKIELVFSPVRVLIDPSQPQFSVGVGAGKDVKGFGGIPVFL